MDFLVSESGLPDSVSSRYDKSTNGGKLWVSYAKTGNLSLYEKDGELVALVSGFLFGALDDIESLQHASKEELGRQALDSDGSFVVAIPKNGQVTILTDAGGSVPVYHAHGPGGLAVGTLVHHVAAVSGCTSIDEISVADYLFNNTICHPYSWYENVRSIPPGAVCSYEDEEMGVYSYWKPTEPDNLYDRDCDIQEWGRRLREQVRRGVCRGIDGKKSGRVLYSGGSDSRAILSLIPDSFDCTPTTVLDSRNREYKLANSSARALGRELERISRPKNHYRSRIPERIDSIGPGWDFQHTHIHGQVAGKYEDTEVVIGGYMADTLFKTVWMSNVLQSRHRRRPDALLQPRPDNVAEPNFDRLDSNSLWSEVLRAVQNRRKKHHGWLKELRPRTAGNWHPRFPLANQPHLAHYLALLRRDFCLVEPFLFHQTYRLAAEMPDPARVEQRAFRRAFGPVMGMAGFCPTSSNRIPRLREWPQAIAKLTIRKFRSVKQRFVPSSGTQGPWPSDASGWHPVVPERHYGTESVEILYQRLSRILADQGESRFFSAEYLPDDQQVRALALGFDFRQI